MRNLLPLVMFIVGAGAIVGGYALIAWLPGAPGAAPDREPASPGSRCRSRELDGRARVRLDPEAAGRSARCPILDRLAGTDAVGQPPGDLISQSGAHVGVSTIVVMSVGLGARRRR